MKYFFALTTVAAIFALVGGFYIKRFDLIIIGCVTVPLNIMGFLREFKK